MCETVCMNEFDDNLLQTVITFVLVEINPSPLFAYIQSLNKVHAFGQNCEILNLH
jgi:hypothetical protein